MHFLAILLLIVGVTVAMGAGESLIEHGVIK